jgi:hypothetical protein
MHEERDDGTDQKNYEQNFRDARRACGQPSETQHSSNERDDQKYDGIMKHVIPLGDMAAGI